MIIGIRGYPIVLYAKFNIAVEISTPVPMAYSSIYVLGFVPSP